MSSPLSWAMMLGIAVETTVCSSAATAIASSRAAVTIRRPGCPASVGPAATSISSGSNPAMPLDPPSPRPGSLRHGGHSRRTRQGAPGFGGLSEAGSASRM